LIDEIGQLLLDLVIPVLVTRRFAAHELQHLGGELPRLYERFHDRFA